MLDEQKTHISPTATDPGSLDYALTIATEGVKLWHDDVRPAPEAKASNQDETAQKSRPAEMCEHRNVSERPKYAIDDEPGHWLCLDCGDKFPLIGNTDEWKPKPYPAKRPT